MQLALGWTPSLGTITPQGFWIFAGVWTIIWLFALATALTRSDWNAEPITRLTWVLVLILVPFFGVVLYWIVAPGNPPRRAEADYTQTPSRCVQCGSRIPAATNRCPKCNWTYEVTPR